MSPAIASVVVEVAPDHLDRPFDYRVPEGLDLAPGSRVEVVFSGRRVRGLVTAVGDTTDVDESRLRDVRRALGEHRWATDEDIDLLRWAATRYAAPLASVVRHALPARIVGVERRAHEEGWYPSAQRPPDPPWPSTDQGAWARYGDGGSELVRLAAGGSGAHYWRPMPAENLPARMVELVGTTLAGGRDALLIVPEPVSKVADAVAAAYKAVAVDVRGAGERRAYRAWLRARTGAARVVVGERGAAFWPLGRLGLAVVVDEANPALKERRAPRHHAREVVLERARRARAVGLVVGGVPSAVAWRLLAERRIRPLVPIRDHERASAPVVIVDDRSDPRSTGRLGRAALDAIRGALGRDELAVVLAVRRGEGRALVCTDCGDRVACPQCGSSLALDTEILCDGCGWSGRRTGFTCSRCGSAAFAPLAAGAERLGQELSRTFAGAKVVVLEGYAQAPPAPPALVVMTRGSALLDPPGPVGAVVLPDLEAQLRRPGLDAAEDALRLAMRLASWTVRPGSETRGTGRVVVVQTREPDHPAVRALVAWDPGGFWHEEVERRRELRFPPVAVAVRLDIGDAADLVAEQLRTSLPDGDEILGPRSVDGRAGLLVKSLDRVATLAALDPLRRAWSQDGYDVRIDVDPVEL